MGEARIQSQSTRHKLLLCGMPTTQNKEKAENKTFERPRRET